ncbi:MAG: hypothetical protein LBS21_00270 [Clostridiales bacterium]|jgi:hypothetical protein|nr:hypothetical protein [Clostridiales bacterium]
MSGWIILNIDWVDNQGGQLKFELKVPEKNVCTEYAQRVSIEDIEKLTAEQEAVLSEVNTASTKIFTNGLHSLIPKQIHEKLPESGFMKLICDNYTRGILWELTPPSMYADLTNCWGIRFAACRAMSGNFAAAERAAAEQRSYKVTGDGSLLNAQGARTLKNYGANAVWINAECAVSKETSKKETKERLNGSDMFHLIAHGVKTGSGFTNILFKKEDESEALISFDDEIGIYPKIVLADCCYSAYQQIGENFDKTFAGKFIKHMGSSVFIGNVGKAIVYGDNNSPMLGSWFAEKFLQEFMGDGNPEFLSCVRTARSSVCAKTDEGGNRVLSAQYNFMSVIYVASNVSPDIKRNELVGDVSPDITRSDLVGDGTQGQEPFWKDLIKWLNEYPFLDFLVGAVPAIVIVDTLSLLMPGLIENLITFIIAFVVLTAIFALVLLVIIPKISKKIE